MDHNSNYYIQKFDKNRELQYGTYFPQKIPAQFFTLLYCYLIDMCDVSYPETLNPDVVRDIILYSAEVEWNGVVDLTPANYQIIIGQLHHQLNYRARDLNKGYTPDTLLKQFRK